MSEITSSLGRLARGALGVALSGVATRGPLASMELKAVAELVVSGGVVRRAPIVVAKTASETRSEDVFVNERHITHARHSATTNDSNETASTSERPEQAVTKPNALMDEKPKVTSSFSSQMAPVRRREVAVPSSPVARVLGFGQLAAGLVAGTMAESARWAWRGGGGKGKETSSAVSLDDTSNKNNQDYSEPLLANDSVFLTEANAERLAVALCRMRGAALKLGQMLSIQDESVVPPAIAKALERVREGADVMPAAQLLETIERHLGKNWRAQNGLLRDGGDVEVVEFDPEPMAAASIGQVHRATVRRRVPMGNQSEDTFETVDVCMKIQYPGVARSIHSDIDNLVRMISMTDLLPKGLYVEHAVATAKEELTLECDYAYELASTDRMRALLHDDPAWKAPMTVPELSCKGVLTTTFAPGMAIDKVATLDQGTRDYVATELLRGTLRELFEFRFMQSDPNFANFLFCQESSQLTMIDFGAAKEYPKQFVDDYLKMVVACAEKDRDGVVESSIKLGFLTGDEAQVLIDAHVEAGFQVGRPFQKSSDTSDSGQSASTHNLYDFSVNRDMTRRVAGLGKVMLKHRLTPPPAEAYSLHRKLSGSFLACMRLNAKVPARKLLMDVYREYKFSDHVVDVGNRVAEATA